MKTKYYVLGMQYKHGFAVTYFSDNWGEGFLTLLRMDTEFIIHSKN